MKKLLLIFSFVLTKTFFSQTKIHSRQADSIISLGGCIMDETMPQFIGGNDSLKKFISRHFKLPDPSNCSEGKIYLKFTVEKDGSLTDIKVVKGLEKKLDVEAIRVVSIMPKWKPATNDGKPFRTFVNLPMKIR